MTFMFIVNRTCVRAVVIYGGTQLGHSIRQIVQGCNILCATPGRLMDVIGKEKVGSRQITKLWDWLVIVLFGKERNLCKDMYVHYSTICILGSLLIPWMLSSTRDECLSPRVRLECNPEIPVAPGEEARLLDTSLDEVYWPCSHSRAIPSFPSQL